MTYTRGGLYAAFVVVLWGSTSCFKSSTLQASSESSSDLISSSSPSDESKLAYRRDVRDVTARHASSGETEALEKDLGTIAERHGITDWERDPQTYLGIGQGLARAGLSGRRLERATTELSHADRQRADWIRAGYRGTATP
jgi:hypothetical protein